MAPKRSASRTREPDQPPEAEPEQIAITSPPVPHVSAQDNPGPSAQQRLLGFRQNLRALVSRQRSSRPNRADYANLVEVVSDALEGFAQHQMEFGADLIRRWEGAESAFQRSPNYNYGLSMVSLMDSMTPEQLHEFKIMLENGSWEIMHHPHPTRVASTANLSLPTPPSMCFLLLLFLLLPRIFLLLLFNLPPPLHMLGSSPPQTLPFSTPRNYALHPFLWPGTLAI
ncbi:uncharacterized protein LOC121005629 [Bufo bufo]|uniref:uncharacterized protein LOC121005629 n=1 Tax=Bufo bufo TaxID=8384 RepID=UPI001ABDA00B|nr:uncharacterized protein LOC121005629 [Bufo bufo]